MAAQLTIKDANGNVLLDLSSSINRFTIDYARTTNPSAVAGIELINLGPKTLRGSIWFLTRFAKTVASNKPNVEVGPFSPYAVYMLDKAELKASAWNDAYKNPILARMDDTSLYLKIVDTRSNAVGGYQNSVTIDVGRF